MDELNEYRAKYIESQKKHAKATDQIKELQSMLEQQTSANQELKSEIGSLKRGGGAGIGSFKNKVGAGMAPPAKRGGLASRNGMSTRGQIAMSTSSSGTLGMNSTSSTANKKTFK